MRISEAFPSKHLKAADVPKDKRIGVTIEAVKIEKVGDDTRPVVYFVGKDKSLVLNITNASMIENITGTDDMDRWTGTRIALYATKVPYNGKLTDAIRVDFPAGQQPAPPPVESDDVPF